jgi:Beta-propeller repeat
MHRAVLVLAVLAGGCFFEPDLGQGDIVCSDEGTCPSGQLCGGDGKCYVPGPPSRVTLIIAPAGAAQLTSVPAGVDCGESGCSVELPSNVPIWLDTVPTPDFRFAGWDGCQPVGLDGTDRRCALELVPGGTADVRARFTPLGGSTIWARSLGGEGVDELYALAIAPTGTPIAGQLRAAGGFASPAFSLGPGFDVANTGLDGYDDALLTGFTLADGATRFARVLGSSAGYDNLWHVAVDSDGFTIVAGYLEGTVDLGGGPRTCQGYDPFVAAYDASGAWLWDRVWTCAGSVEDEAEAVALDENGDVFVTGTFAGGCDFGDHVVRDGGGGAPFVLKLDGAHGGATVWARHFPTGAGGTGSGLRAAAAGNGDVAVAGWFRNALVDASSGTQLDSDGRNEDVFVLRLSGQNGALVWARRFGGPGADWANSVAIDSDDNVLVTGRFQDSVSFAGPARAAVGLADGFLLKLSGSGTPAWDRTFGGVGDDDGYGVAVDFARGDDVLVAGGIDGTVDFGAGFVLSTQHRDGFAARYSVDGEGPEWVRQFGGGEDDTVFDVGVGPENTSHDVFVVGSFRGSADLGGGLVRTAMGEEDAFVLGLAP